MRITGTGAAAAGRGARRGGSLLLTLLVWVLACPPPPLAGETLGPYQINDAQGNEITIERNPADGDLLVIWLVDHAEHRPMFESMLRAINAAGVELWRVDLLDAYFLPRSSETVRTLDGEGVTALLQAAHQRSDKTVLLAAYDRMPLPLLRGVRQWQSRHQGESRLAGALLFYPNLFGPPPVAGSDPELDPVVGQTDIPLVLLQPEYGNHRWRLEQVMEAFWSAGSAAFFYLVPEVRDWYFMHEPGTDAAETAATRSVPAQVRQFADLMSVLPKPLPRPTVGQLRAPSSEVLGLVALTPPPRAPRLDLPTSDGGRLRIDDYRGRVTLVNFWATWCPPCVDEVPSLNRLQERLGGAPFQLISIDFRESPQQILEFTDKIQVEFPILLDTAGLISRQWKVFGFPSSFLIGKDGHIRYSVNRAIDWDDPEVTGLLQQLLDESVDITLTVD